MPWTPWTPWRRPPAAEGPTAPETETVAASEQRQPAAVVPADSTISDVLAAYRANAAGIAGLIWLTGNGEPLAFGPVLRCVDLLSGVFAQLITQPGSLHIRRPDGSHATGPRWDGIVRWLAETPDGGETPPFQWWADYSSDYCFGNALATKRDPSRRALVRLRASSAGSIVGPQGTLVYVAQPFDDSMSIGEQWTIPRRRMIHSRWPQTSSALQDSRRLFADAPLQVVRLATQDGQRMDAWIRQRFGIGAWKQGVVMSQDDEYGAGGTGESGAFLKMAMAWSNSPPEKQEAFPWGTKVMAQRLEPTVGEFQTVEMRNQMVRTVGSIFGVPSPYLNEEVSAWGSGIEQLSRIFWRTSAHPKLLSLLSPFSARLLPPGYSFGVDESEYLRGDWESTAKLLTSIYQGSSQSDEPPDLTRSERRHLLGAPPDDEPEGNGPPERPDGVAPPPPFMGG